MTERKPKGSAPVAPQRPKSSQSDASTNGVSKAAAPGDSPTQAIPKVNDDQPSSGANRASDPKKTNSVKESGASTSDGPAKAEPAATSGSGPATARQSASPKTAGEIAAETNPGPPPRSPRPAPNPTRQPTSPQSAPAPAADSAAARTARLRLARIDPWSVMKVSFALSIALAIVTVIAISIVWFVLGAAGVWDAVNSSVASLLSDDAQSFDITEYVGYGRVVGFALLVSAVDVVLITAIATLGAFLYNLAASLLGGLELTLAEDT